MSKIIAPHIVIEAHISATKRLWDKLEKKPIVWTPNPLSSDLLGEKLPDGGLALTTVGFWRLNEIARGGDVDEEYLRQFEGHIEDAQELFGLKPDEKLNVVLVGSHTTLSSHDDAGENVFRGSDKEKPRYKFGQRSDRTFSALIYRFLNKYDALNIEWLAYADPDLTPKRSIEDLPEIYHKLPAMAASDLEEYERAIEPTPILAKPTIPMVYFRSTVDGEWTKFEGSTDREVPRTPTTTSKLIHEFGEWSESNAFDEAVLVKMLSQDLRPYNPIDPPYLREEQIRRANAAGLSKIFLDNRIGILQTVTGTPPSPPPVYSIQPPADEEA